MITNIIFEDTAIFGLVFLELQGKGSIKSIVAVILATLNFSLTP